MYKIYPEIEPFEEGWLQVDPLHKIYWQQSGNPKGQPVVVLHGGPGAGINPDHRRYFDPDFYRIIAFDQRGAGRSLPSGELRNNTTDDLVRDIEMLREHLNVFKWLVSGSSWGSTLSLYYAQSHPKACQGLILRSIFLGRDLEMKWITHDVRAVFPDAWEKFAHFIAPEKREDLFKAYYELLMNPDHRIHGPAAAHCLEYYGKIFRLLPYSGDHKVQQKDPSFAVYLARIQSHYYANHMFLEGYNLLDNMDKISHLPGYIIHGRYDMCCPLIGAFDLAQLWKKAELVVVPDAGHSNIEGSFPEAIVKASESFKKLL